ncbi:MAG: GIY-YIG nuclease family protein [Cyclobacteriaceae bacterium]|nr:GIY-YIG nuclease family protein [Cyclobacteriaceae bacterium]
MASVYILHSKKLDRFYIGSCKNLSYRIDQHLSKSFSRSFTARAEDWQLFFSMDELQFGQARLIERHLKQMKSRRYLENLKKYPEIAQNLIMKYRTA